MINIFLFLEKFVEDYFEVNLSNVKVEGVIEVDVESDEVFIIIFFVCSCEFVGVECCLEIKDLWDKFYELGMEMIIIKIGR